MNKLDVKRFRVGTLALFAVLASIGLAGCGDDGANSRVTQKDPCLTAECGENLTCITEGSIAKCVCGPEKKTCGSDQICAENDCYNKCGDTYCKGEEICRNGKCMSLDDIINTVSCALIHCPEGTVCDPITVECKCGDKVCASDEVCKSDVCEKENDIVINKCEGVVCPEGTTCDEETGACKCGDIVCNIGESCVKDECKKLNPCENVACKGEAVCSDGKCLCGDDLLECGEDEICKEGSCQKGSICDPVCIGDAVCMDGVCVCGETACDDGYVCSGDKCLCGGSADCDPANHVCENGECIEIIITPCTRHECAEGEGCIVIEEDILGEDGNPTGEKQENPKCVDLQCIVKAETEDGKDTEKDCSGEGEGFKCIAGECKDPRCFVEGICPEDLNCGIIDGDVYCLCGEELCKDGENCVQGECIDPCEGVECQNEMTCVQGECGCGESRTVCNVMLGEVCNNEGECDVAACSPKCDDGLACIDKQCVCAGSGRACDSDEICYDGVCIDALCQDKTCPEGYLCDKGECVYAACKGIICPENEGCNKVGDCVFKKCVDVTCSTGKTCQEDGSCHYNEPPVLSVNTQNDVMYTTESGIGNTLIVVISLSKVPDKEVVVKGTVSETGEALFLGESSNVATIDLRFPANTNAAQIATIVGIPDLTVDGDKNYQVSFIATSNDTDFNGLNASLDLVNKDVDKAEIVISDQTGSTTSESGTTVTFKVNLTSKPASDVTINLTSSNPEEGVVSPASLTFTANDYSNQQLVTVTGVPDGVKDGNQSYQIDFTVNSTDSNYDNITINPIQLMNTDINDANILTSGNLVQNEGETANIGVKLSTKPLQDVTITASVQNSSDEIIIASGESLVFTQSNFDTEQIIGLQFPIDNIKDGNQDWTIQLNAIGGTDYNDKTVSVDGTTMDVDTAELVFSSCFTATAINEGESQTCLVKLSSQPQGDVTVNVTSNNTSLGATVSPASLSFAGKGTDWSTNKTVTVTGVKDNQVDGTKIPTISFKTVSSDDNFDKLNVGRTVTVNDIDSAGIVFSSYDTVLSEGSPGTPHYITVSLNSKPTQNVTLSVTGYDSTEVMISPASDIITPGNWNSGVKFTYYAVDDSALDGEQITRFIFKTSSSDSNYSGLSKTTNNIKVADNETAGINVTAAGTTTLLSCGTANQRTLNVKLNNNPNKPVIFKLDLVDKDNNVISNVTNGVKLDKTSLTFTETYGTAVQTVIISSPTSSTTCLNSGTSCPAKAYYSTVKLRLTETNGLALGYGGKTFYSGDVADLKAFCDPGSYGVGQKALYLPKGRYSFILNGAGGKSSDCQKSSSGGKGGRVAGVYDLKNTSNKVYLTVGGTGGDCEANSNCGGYNGGGIGATKEDVAGIRYHGFGGGGATDVRLNNTNMGQRFLVAGGGGGGACYRTSDPNAGGNGGGTSGNYGQQAGGTSDSNTRPGSTNGCAGNNSTNCPFGTPSAASYNDSTGGGGGGWFSGMGGQDTRVTGAGGSSFVYGFNTNVNNRCTVSSSDITYVSGGVNNSGGGSSASSAGSAKITVGNVEI